MSDPIVHFPNLTAKAHNVVLTLVCLAYHQTRPMLPVKYKHVYNNLPAGNTWMVADDFAECFRKLGALTVEELGEIPGVTMKHLTGDIATMICRRAIQTCERIQRLAQSATSAKQVEGCRELEFFGRDVTILKAILDSRRAFIPNHPLLTYLALSESIVAYIRGNVEAEQLNRKIRAITRPRAPRPAQPVVPVAAPAVAVTDMIVELTTPEVEGPFSQDVNPS